jgi:hypothetical protein
MLLQKVYCRLYAKLCQVSTQYHSIAKVSQGSRGTTTSLAPCEPRWVTTPIFHSSEQGTLPTASLISKQAAPYWTRGDTYCPRVSTPMTQSLADLSMTIHITWGIQLSRPIPTLLKPQHRSSPRSPHITTDGILTLNNNTSQTQHHEDGKTCMTLMIAWLSITSQVWTQILKYEA